MIKRLKAVYGAGWRAGMSDAQLTGFIWVNADGQRYWKRRIMSATERCPQYYGPLERRAWIAGCEAGSKQRLYNWLASVKQRKAIL